LGLLAGIGRKRNGWLPARYATRRHPEIDFTHVGTLISTALIAAPEKSAIGAVDINQSIQQF
jgi:hypothetical protein